MTITRSKIIEKLDMFNAKDGDKFLEKLLSILQTTFVKGEDIKITNFGKFVVSSKKERMGRNPKTGEALKLPARKVVKFKPSEMLKEAVNKK